MKIAVCGAGDNPDKETAEKAFNIGKEIASNGILLLTGACNGYPYEAAKGCFSVLGKVFGISPAKDKREHTERYKFPTDAFSEIEFTGLGIPGRNFALVKEADAAIIIGGQIGTLNEFTIAFHAKKPIGILKGSGGITEILDKVIEICDKNGEKEKVVFSGEPKELVKAVSSIAKQ